MSRNFKFLLFALIVLAIAGGTYAFAAANTVDVVPQVGYVANSVSGYDITDVTYNLNTNLNSVETITFTIDGQNGIADPVTVKVQTGPSGSWTICDVEELPAVTCQFSELQVKDFTTLNIYAASY
jgi:hypothetical protein